ncbi:hypothetical protein J6590_051755 [Homalodisca vitripennis]|nr:hypothetical protein J6590_051755 [Homalodisca vitripennis]
MFKLPQIQSSVPSRASGKSNRVKRTSLPFLARMSLPKTILALALPELESLHPFTLADRSHGTTPDCQSGHTRKIKLLVGFGDLNR